MRSRLRRLHVDGREFTWRAEVRSAPGPDGRRHRCIRIRVWGAGKNGHALQADLTANRPGPQDTAFPAADDVRVLVAYGLRAGWTPERVGGTFQVTSAADVALSGFAVTDRLWAADRPG